MLLVYAVRAMPGFMLSFADLMGIPSGLHVAFGLACAAAGKSVTPTIAGSAAGILLRLLSGVAVRWELLISLALLYPAQRMLQGCTTALLLAAGAVGMLPVAIAASISPTAAEMIRGWASLAITMLSSPVYFRAIRALQVDRHFAGLEERLAVGYMAMTCVAGGARMFLLGMNIGMLLASSGTLAMATALGVGPGILVGLLSGVILSMQGLPLAIAVALAMGGFLAGIAKTLSRRILTSAFFSAGACTLLILTGSAGSGCGISVLAASGILTLLPREMFERIQQFLRRFLPNDPSPGDAYAAAALRAWEHTVAALARAVPSPKDAMESRDGAWWENQLCQGCPERSQCGCMTTDVGVEKAEQVWEYRHAQEEVWQGALEGLRGMGCQRLYYMMEAMSALRQEDEAEQRIIRQAEAQREMLVTHLTAMSGAARRFAALSSGESWWDHVSARRLRKILSERAMPVTLSYVRRVQGHVQAAFELHMITGARCQAEALCDLTAVVLEAPMCLSSLDGDRVLLRECPILSAEIGAAAEAMTGNEICGDTYWSGILQDGRCLVALSDGMGHGERAAMSSRQTVELLRLCLDAGYTRQQTLTAVNGMLLLGGGGERFATADVLTIDLWRGHAALDKLGAAASWLYRKNKLSRLIGDALPLGILEDIDLNGCEMTLEVGDAVVLLTDGIEDAFWSVSALEGAICTALEANAAKDAAEALLQAAMEADEGQRRDDQSVVVVYIRRQTGKERFTSL